MQFSCLVPAYPGHVFKGFSISGHFHKCQDNYSREWRRVSRVRQLHKTVHVLCHTGWFPTSKHLTFFVSFGEFEWNQRSFFACFCMIFSKGNEKYNQKLLKHYYLCILSWFSIETYLEYLVVTFY